MARTQKRSFGYTLIEVMTAVTIMIVGASGIVLMQGATTFANHDAQELTAAMTFANTWVDRIKRDSLNWTSNGETTLAATQFLNPAVYPYNNWYVPALNAGDPQSVGADYRGFDTKVATDMWYCVNLRSNIAQLANLSHNGGVPGVNLLRVDVLVWWYRGGRGDQTTVNRLSGQAGCAAPLTAGMLASNTIRTLTLSTLVHWVAP